MDANRHVHEDVHEDVGVDVHVDVRADLKAYYEQEAQQRTRKPLAGPRVVLRSEFLEILKHEGRRSIVDFGSGPGRDGAAFFQAGHRYLGVDLAYGNATLAAERGIDVVPSSIAEPPLRDHSFDAGWSMSTLMHLPDTEVPDAMVAMTAVLRPGAPMVIGLWGGELGDHIDDTQLAGQRRLFSLRSPKRNRELLESAAQVEHEEVWSDAGPDGWHYQVFRLRTPT